MNCAMPSAPGRTHGVVLETAFLPNQVGKKRHRQIVMQSRSQQCFAQSVDRIGWQSIGADVRRGGRRRLGEAGRIFALTVRCVRRRLRQSQNQLSVLSCAPLLRYAQLALKSDIASSGPPLTPGLILIFGPPELLLRDLSLHQERQRKNRSHLCSMRYSCCGRVQRRTVQRCG